MIANIKILLTGVVNSWINIKLKNCTRSSLLRPIYIAQLCDVLTIILRRGSHIRNMMLDEKFVRLAFKSTMQTVIPC